MMSLREIGFPLKGSHPDRGVGVLKTGKPFLRGWFPLPIMSAGPLLAAFPFMNTELLEFRPFGLISCNYITRLFWVFDLLSYFDKGYVPFP